MSSTSSSINCFCAGLASIVQIMLSLPTALQQQKDLVFFLWGYELLGVC